MSFLSWYLRVCFVTWKLTFYKHLYMLANTTNSMHNYTKSIIHVYAGIKVARFTYMYEYACSVAVHRYDQMDVCFFIHFCELFCGAGVNISFPKTPNVFWFLYHILVLADCAVQYDLSQTNPCTSLCCMLYCTWGRDRSSMRVTSHKRNALICQHRSCLARCM